MIPKQSLSANDITSLLSKMKDETPEYPAQLMEARKTAFLQQAASLNIPGKGQGGQGGQAGGASGSGGSGATMGGTATGQGFLLQVLIGFSIVAAMLLTAFAYREQIAEILHENGDVAVEQPLIVDESLSPNSNSTPFAIATVFPPVTVTLTQPVPTGTNTTDLESVFLNGTPGIESILGDSKTNPGLHLGQTPGTPAAPGQGNPGNINQPDKPNKPIKPDKPDNPNKPEKPGNSNKK